MTGFPASTRAVLVGVEQYRLGPDWELDGPVLDVVKFARWLIDNGVPPENITGAVSPLPANAPACAQSGLPIHWRTADSDQVRTALTTELHSSASDVLFVYLGGHGFFAERDRRIVYPDATEADIRNLNVTSLLESMRSIGYTGHRRQLIVVDTCLIETHDLDWRNGIPNETFPSSHIAPEINQAAFFAASPSQIAINDGASGTGLFSAALRDVLHSLDPRHLFPAPDSDVIRDELRRRFEVLRQDGRTDQVPSHLVFGINGSEEVQARPTRKVMVAPANKYHVEVHGDGPVTSGDNATTIVHDHGDRRIRPRKRRWSRNRS
ncbi:hypothetical protein [Nocardia beijingensis]|uniref:hypothetical protein n=1 Tax=Nocardia beijingensis TaxID=95162 RepID=UPI0033B50527